MDDVTALKHHVISDRPDASTSHPLPREKKSVNINTSLSTLSPAHYEAMNSPASPLEKNLPGGRPLTMRDVVLWQQEQAQHRGELGFTTNFADPSTIFKPFNTNASSEDDLPAEDDAALIAAMQETHRATVQLQQRKIIMDGAQPLLAKTETDVTRKLLAEGVALQELQNKGLRQKIVQLVELKKPPPKANFVSVVVSVASTIKGQSHMLEINLPLKACVEEIYALLDQVIKVLLSEKGLSYERGGIWKYQLIDHNRSRLLMDKSLPIGTDLDYKKMLQQVSKVSDGKAPVAVLTQVCLCANKF